MKKVLVFLLVAFVAIAGVFAVDISLGLGTGLEQEFLVAGGKMEETGLNSIRFDKIPVVAVSSFDFSNNFSLGIDLGINACFNDSIGYVKESSFIPLFLGVTAYHRFELPLNFNLYLGGGFRYILTIMDSQIGETAHGLSMMIDVKASYNVLENLVVFCRANFGTSLCKFACMSGEGMDFSSGMYKYIQWSTIIGAAYKF